MIDIDKTGNRTRPIFNQRMAGYLLQRGFVLVDIDDNRDGSGRKVFYFNNTQEVRDAVGEYLSMNCK